MLGKLFSLAFLAVVAVALVALHPLLLGAVGDQLVEDDRLQPADAIIVLAGTSPYRAEHAVELYHQGWARNLVISDEKITSHGLNTTWGALYAAGVARLDVPQEAVETLPGIADDTHEEATKSRDVLLAHGWKRAIVVTDPFHSHRAELLFRAAFKPAGLEAYMSPAMQSPLGVQRWWTSTEGMQRVVTEYVKLGWASYQGQV